MKSLYFTCSDPAAFREKLICRLEKEPYFVYLDSHRHLFPPGAVSYASDPDFMAAALPLKTWTGKEIFDMPAGKNYHFGYAGYDLKNYFENLHSAHPAYGSWPEAWFFEPGLMISGKKNEICITAENPEEVYKNIESLVIPAIEDSPRVMEEKYLLGKEAYVEVIQALKKEIAFGNIYEINYCNAISGKLSDTGISHIWKILSAHHPAPFSGIMRYKNNIAFCCSPERFLAKRGNKLITPPVKGTVRRGQEAGEEDELLKKQLYNDPKERSENIMIVDLCRNDLARVCRAGSVKVEELCGIYTFPSVHQMISTVSGELEENKSFADILRALFPMGSMTGAPKVRAMELIEKHEVFRRGLFSGSIGYFTPGGDFDFNVVIRTLLVNSEDNSFLYPMGSAVTFLSDPLQEWAECLLKAKTLESLRH